MGKQYCLLAFAGVFVDDKLTAALLDRIGQRADVRVTRGPGDRGPAQSRRSEPKEEKPA